MARDMSACVFPLFFLAFFISVNCSRIITKDMIRMPNKKLHLDTDSRNLENSSINSESTAYEQIFPPTYLENKGGSTDSRAIAFPPISSTLQRDSLPLKTVLNSSPSIPSIAQDQNKTQHRYTLKEAWHTNISDPYMKNDEDENNTHSTMKISYEELSKQYWDQYKNYSFHLLNTTSLQRNAEGDLRDEKGFLELVLFEVLQRILDCPWSLGVSTCIRELFKEEPKASFDDWKLHYPRFNQEDDGYGQDFDSQGSDIDKGRKKLSKKLQLLLPILMMLKMTMLPALAVMALVSGKAFLISLLSLGVALVSTFMHPSVLHASKRNEITPQAPQPADQLPNNYYYVM